MSVELENRAEYDALIKKTPVVVVLAHAQYAPPSRAFKIEFADLAREHAVEDKFVFAHFDAFDADDINSELSVRTFPAYFFFKDGALVKSTLSANASKQALEKDIKELGPQ